MPRSAACSRSMVRSWPRARCSRDIDGADRASHDVCDLPVAEALHVREVDRGAEVAGQFPHRLEDLGVGQPVQRHVLGGPRGPAVAGPALGELPVLETRDGHPRRFPLASPVAVDERVGRGCAAARPARWCPRGTAGSWRRPWCRSPAPGPRRRGGCGSWPWPRRAAAPGAGAPHRRTAPAAPRPVPRAPRELPAQASGLLSLGPAGYPRPFGANPPGRAEPGPRVCRPRSRASQAHDQGTHQGSDGRGGGNYRAERGGVPGHGLARPAAEQHPQQSVEELASGPAGRSRGPGRNVRTGSRDWGPWPGSRRRRGRRGRRGTAGGGAPARPGARPGPARRGGDRNTGGIPARACRPSTRSHVPPRSGGLPGHH